MLQDGAAAPDIVDKAQHRQRQGSSHAPSSILKGWTGGAARIFVGAAVGAVLGNMSGFASSRLRR